ncbi:MAG: 2,3-bisphosphoglycerate-independent phosphoglycerate mutase [Legionellaceae bacterium]|nr:2,3-bisphosphoglycerate-independent phosphoglycerate mutase [Legionellaceae bacterium]
MILSPLFTKTFLPFITKNSRAFSTTRTRLLLILDGLGHSEKKEYNAVAAAHTPTLDNLLGKYPNTLLNASGSYVGLPKRQVGNSEAGHCNIGSGTTIRQDYTLIEDAIASGDFANNPVFLEEISHLKTNAQNLHVLGLLSDGGVHSHEKHLLAFLDICIAQKFFNVQLHLFLDGRDTPPRSALESLKRLRQYFNNNLVNGKPAFDIASMTGRHIAMDRNQNWERTKTTYTMLTEKSSATPTTTPEESIINFYEKNDSSDEFFPATRFSNSTISDGDSVFSINYRPDRIIQITEAFTNDKFNGFTRNIYPKLNNFISMMNYSDDLDTTCAFTREIPSNTLGEVVSKHGPQLRLAESEKFPHVTYFLNGGLSTPFPGEDRILVPSPDVETYDLQPDMSAKEVTQHLVEAIYKQKYLLIVCNLANADMVGHTGNFDATVATIECIDKCLAKILKALQDTSSEAIITADHGNAEKMFDEETQQTHTAHTSNLVPCIYIGDPQRRFKQNLTGDLTNLAPTMLELLGIDKPNTMKSSSLLTENTIFTKKTVKKEDVHAVPDTDLTRSIS